MRWRAQEIITRELGPRTELEVSRKRSTDIERERFTDTDRTLAERAGPDGAVSLRALLQDGSPEGRRCIARLQALEGFQLAHVERPGTWRLADGWKESLHELGQYHDVAGRLLPMVGREAAMRHRIVDEKRPVPPFEGVVMGKGLDDELAGTMFVALRTSAGDAVYLRVPPNIAESLREGVTVRVTFDVEPWLKPADRIIARFAQENERDLQFGPPSKGARKSRSSACRDRRANAGRTCRRQCEKARASQPLRPRGPARGWPLGYSGRPSWPARRARAEPPQHRLRVEQFREPDRAREQRGDAQPATQPRPSTRRKNARRLVRRSRESCD